MYNSETRGAQNRDGFYFRQLNIPKNSGWFFFNFTSRTPLSETDTTWFNYKPDTWTHILLNSVMPVYF